MRLAKRIISILLVLILFTSLLTTTAYAYDDYDIADSGANSIPVIRDYSFDDCNVYLIWDEVPDTYKYRVLYKRASWNDYVALADVTSNQYKDTDLKLDIDYVYTIARIDSQGNIVGNYDTKGTKITLHYDTPHIKSASPYGSNLTLSWDEIEGCHKYEVFYRWDSWNEWKSIGKTSSTSFTDTGLVRYRSYRYAVRCIDERNRYTSDIENPGTLYTMLLSTPHINSAVPCGTNIKFSWNKIFGAYKYETFYKRTSWNYWKSLGFTSDTSFEDTGLVYGVDYQYCVQCVDQNNRYISDYDKEGYSYKINLEMPKIYNAVPDGTSLKLYWNSVVGAYQYEVLYRRAEWTNWVSIGKTSDTTFTDTGLANLRKYYYTVRCIGQSGSVISSYDTVGYPFHLGLDQPKIKSAVHYGSSLTLSWDSVTGANRYEVVYKRKDMSEWKSLGYTGGNSFVDTGLVFDRDYYYAVRVVDSNGKVLSLTDDEVLHVKLHLESPNAKITYSEDDKVAFSWDKVDGAVSYRVFYKRADWDEYKTLDDITSTSYQDYGCVKGVVYEYCVKCLDQSGKVISDAGDVAKYIDYADEPEIKNTFQNGSSIVLTCVENRNATTYKYYYRRKGWDYWVLVDTTRTNSGSDYGLAYGVNYEYKVECYDSRDNLITKDIGLVYSYTLKLVTPRITSAVFTGDVIKVNWGQVVGAEYYKVYYKRDTWGKDEWRYLTDVSTNSFVDDDFSMGVTYQYSVVAVDANGLVSAFNDVGEFVTVTDEDFITLYEGQSFHAYLDNYSGVSWSSSNSSIAKVNANGFVTAVKSGYCEITGKKYSYSTKFRIQVVGKAPIRFAYTYPNCAPRDSYVQLVAITDTGVTDVEFYVENSSYVSATSCETDSYNGRSVYVWTAKQYFSTPGTYDVVAYSKRGSGSAWQTCDDGTCEAFITSSNSMTNATCETRRVSGQGLEFIAICEGFISEIYDDTLAPGNYTVGYGKVIQKGETFYNNLTKKEAYAYLVQTCNNGVYTSKTNQVLMNNGTKYNQNQFDALVSLVYNCGTGIYSDSDLVALRNCSGKNLNNATKDEVVRAFCDYHHAGGCIRGLLTRRIDECEMFLIGDYTRDYGYVNRCNIYYTCYKNKDFHFPD